MNPLSLALLVLFAAPSTLAAPVAADNATLLANGQDAQRLNAEFANLTTSASCTDGQNACIQNDFANCNGGKWRTQACPGSKSCFALPYLRSNGTFVACTSQNNALSILSATGVTGGFNVTDASNSTVVPFPTASNSSTSSTSNSTSSAHNGEGDGDDDCDDDDDGTTDNGNNNGGDDDGCNDDGDGASGSNDSKSSNATTTVTITITVDGRSTSTVGSSGITTTVAASETAGILSSLTASASSVTVLPPTASSTGASSASMTATGGVRDASPTSSVIKLNSPSASVQAGGGGVTFETILKPSASASTDTAPAAGF